MSTPASRPPATSLYPVLLLMVAMVSMQGGASLAKSLFPAVGAQGTAALRLLFSALMLLAYFRPWRVRLPASGWRVVLAYGLSLGAMNLLFYMALRTIPLGMAVALEFTGPLAVALLSSRRLTDFAWIALAAAGLLLLVPHGADMHTLDPAGMAYALAAGLCWALYIVSGRRAGTRHGTQTVALAASVAALAVLPFGLAQAGPALFSPALLPLAVGVAILSSSLPYALEITVLARMPVRVFGTLLSLEPVFAAVSGLLFLGEILTLTQWAAVAAIVAASAGITAGSGKSAPPRARKAPRPGRAS
ncbi:putative membrane protein [Bordetella petrii]|uniref:Membrane protein n=2 Tax=Bordetella petrii TaxID=94624 RepID=A9I0B7_BORPD|nr:putative membrane protein [Bordetella petrii]